MIFVIAEQGIGDTIQFARYISFIRDMDPKEIFLKVDKKLAYISDVSKIHRKDYKFFKKLKYLVIDCLWYKNS